MKITVSGGMKKPLLFQSDDFTGVLIETGDDAPAVIYKILPDKKGFIRFTKGEDKNFDIEARQLQLI